MGDVDERFDVMEAERMYVRMVPWLRRHPLDNSQADCMCPPVLTLLHGRRCLRQERKTEESPQTQEVIPMLRPADSDDRLSIAATMKMKKSSGVVRTHQSTRRRHRHQAVAPLTLWDWT